MDSVLNLLQVSGNAVVSLWIGIFVLTSLLAGAARISGYVRTMKIQQRPISWRLLRHELFWSACNVFCSTLVLTVLSNWLVQQGLLETNTAAAAWYVVAFEFLLFFFIFDLYFYLVHRALHVQPLFNWIHKTNHRSLNPRPLSYASMSPLEGISEGLIIPLFLSLFTVHETSTYFILPFASLMGLYVHCGYEFAPRWWYQVPATKWLITPMYHSQHHQYFTSNYGAFTTIWDRLFGTMRADFEQDFNRLKSRRANPATQEAS